MKVKKAYVDKEGKEIVFNKITGFKTMSGKRGVFNSLGDCWIMINPTQPFEAVSFIAHNYDELEKQINYFTENDSIEKLTTTEEISIAVLAVLDEALNEQL